MKMYQFSAAVLLLIAAASVTEAFDQNKLIEVGMKCKEETKTPDEDVQAIMNKQPPKSNEAKCMMACIFKEMGLLTAEGQFDADANVKAAEETFKDEPEKVNRAKQFTAACKDRVNAVQDDEKGCERAAVMHQCAIERMKAAGIQ